MKNTYSHIYLYAKYWYERTDTLQDLKKILAVRSNMEIRFVTEQDVIRMVSGCVFDSIEASGNPPHFFTKLVLDINRGYDLIDSMLGILRIRTLSNEFQLDEPDYTILPKRIRLKGEL